MDFILKTQEGEDFSFKVDNFGEWVLEPQRCANGALPQKLATAFYDLFSDITSVRYTPLVYCGRQLVNGTNYMIICKASYTTNPLKIGVVKIILHETIPCRGIFGEFSVLSIETIVEEGQEGGYKLMPFVYIPGELTHDPIKAAFDEATKDFDGSLITPFAFCGTQFVSNSTNHMYICTLQTVVPNSKQNVGIIVLNEKEKKFELLPNITIIV